MTPDKIPDDMIRAFNEADFSGCGNADWEDSHIRAGLAAALAGYKLTKLCDEELTPALRCTREVYGEPHRGDHEGITSTGNKVRWSTEVTR